MLKYVILASLLLVSQIFGYSEGGGCNKDDIDNNIKVCDSKDFHKKLKCVARSFIFENSYGFWDYDSTCGYCCELFNDKGPYCVFSKADCEKDKKAYRDSMKSKPRGRSRRYGEKKKEMVVPNKPHKEEEKIKGWKHFIKTFYPQFSRSKVVPNKDQDKRLHKPPKVIVTMVPGEKINESSNKVQ